MIRAIDQWAARHPKLSIALAVLVVFACLYAARKVDQDNTAELRLQMFLSSGRTP